MGYTLHYILDNSVPIRIVLKSTNMKKVRSVAFVDNACCMLSSISHTFKRRLLGNVKNKLPNIRGENENAAIPCLPPLSSRQFLGRVCPLRTTVSQHQGQDGQRALIVAQHTICVLAWGSVVVAFSATCCTTSAQDTHAPLLGF